MVIDNCGFHDIAGIRKMKLADFIEQYKDQKPPVMSEANWLQWMKDAYKTICDTSLDKEKSGDAMIDPIINEPGVREAIEKGWDNKSKSVDTKQATN